MRDVAVLSSASPAESTHDSLEGNYLRVSRAIKSLATERPQTYHVWWCGNAFLSLAGLRNKLTRHRHRYAAALSTRRCEASTKQFSGVTPLPRETTTGGSVVTNFRIGLDSSSNEHDSTSATHRALYMGWGTPFRVCSG